MEPGTSVRTLVLQSMIGLTSVQLGAGVRLERLQLLNCPSVDALDLRPLQQGPVPQQQLQKVRV